MFKWQEVEADAVILSVERLLADLDWCNAIKIIMRSIEAPLVFVTGDCINYILAHLSSDDRELGGVLAGRIYSLSYKVDHSYPFISIITDAVPSMEFENSSVSLRMEAEVWSRADELLSEEKAILGWYHSHPGIGAFFSGTDRGTQRAFFKNAYSLGLVSDPMRGQWKCYCGPDSEEIHAGLTIVE